VMEGMAPAALAALSKKASAGEIRQALRACMGLVSFFPMFHAHKTHPHRHKTRGAHIRTFAKIWFRQDRTRIGPRNRPRPGRRATFFKKSYGRVPYPAGCKLELLAVEIATKGPAVEREAALVPQE